MKSTLAGVLLVLVSTAAADTAKKSTPFDNRTPPPKPAVVKPPPATYSGLGAESVTPEDIAKFAAPQLDGKISRRIQTMLDVRGTGGGALTKKGDRMFFNWRVTGTTQVWRQDGAMKLPVQLTGGEDNTSLVSLAYDDSYAVVSRDVGGQENPGLYLLDPNGGPLKLIQHTPKVQTALQFISEDSKSIYFSANDI